MHEHNLLRHTVSVCIRCAKVHGRMWRCGRALRSGRAVPITACRVGRRRPAQCVAARRRRDLHEERKRRLWGVKVERLA